jgi:hypothetical protein
LKYPRHNSKAKMYSFYLSVILVYLCRRVTKLDVVGPIPSELQNLTYLEDLNLGYNYLTGAMPSFMGKFTSMKYL